MDQIHGHEVMRMMLENRSMYSRESLRTEIIQRFGKDTRFFTCSASNMSADELIDFLASRNKFVEDGDHLGMEPERICDH